MIKEIDFINDSTKNERLYGYVQINTVMEQPFKMNIEIIKEVEYFNKKLSESNIHIMNNIPEADWIAVDRWIKLVCVSRRFKNIFENKLKGYFYPTNNSNYYIFLLDNCIDALSNTTIIINHKEKPYWYESIENESFKKEVENNDYLFSVKEEPNRKFCTKNFEDIYKENKLTGIQFYKDINFKRKDKYMFDMFRWKKYDEEGNCLE